MANVNMKDYVDALTEDSSPESTDYIYVRTVAGSRKRKITDQLNGISSLAIKTGNGGDIGGYLMDGVNDYITVPDDANLDFGLSDFSLELFVRLADYTPSAELILLEKHASILGYKLLLTTAGKLKLQFGIGTNFTTFSYESDATGASDDSWAHFLVTADRDGNALYYVNGILNKTVDISGSVAQTLDNTGALNVFGNGTVYTAGRVAIVRAYNRILTATETANTYNNGRPDLYELPYTLNYGALVYTSNFASDVDSWAAARGTITGNVDGITDGTTSYDDVLSFYADGALNDRYIAKATAQVAGKRCIEKFKIYIPSTNTNIDGFAMAIAGGGSSSGFYTINSFSVTKVADGTAFGTILGGQCTVCDGFWLQVVCDINYLYPNQTNPGVMMMKGTSQSFTGANSASDDLVYIYDYTRTVLGNRYEYCHKNAGSLGWIESSGNQLSAATSGSPICLTKESRPPHYRDIRKAIAANTDTTLTSIVPRGYKIVSIRAKGSDSLADIKIGTASAGEQIVAATTTSSTTPKLLTLAATANDAYSESTDVTLYARHDTSASGKTMDLIFHFEKVGN